VEHVAFLLLEHARHILEMLYLSFYKIFVN